ncbi:MAG: colanic acid biosynthesis glycosyltransferase WcaL, partial [Hyphomicrobiales bacterium]
MTRKTAFILKGYPRLSETFIAQEIHGLEQMGLDIRIYSLRPPREAERHPINAEIRAQVVYLPEHLEDDPVRVRRAFRRVWWWPGFIRARLAYMKDRRRSADPDLKRRFGQAAVLAAELPPNIEWLHAHFLHTPATVTRYASLITGLPWSCSAHARDI